MGKIRILTEEEIQHIIKLYIEDKFSTNTISEIMHLNKKKIYEVLEANEITLRKKGELNTKIDKEAVKTFNQTPKYIPKDGFTFVAISKKDGTEFSDYLNKSGALSRYIKKEYNIDAPSNYMSSLYYFNNKSYWFEEYFNIIERPIVEKKKGKGVILSEQDKDDIVKLYVEQTEKIDSIATLYHVGKKKIEAVLEEKNIERRKLGEKNRKLKCGPVVAYKENPKYIERDGFHFVAVSKLDGRKFNDYLNKSGCLTSYIRNIVKIEIPSLYEMRKYYQETGNYWFEQWFNIIEYANELQNTIKCPYCEWETIDMNNKGGFLGQHIKKAHNKTYEDILNECPEYVKYFKADAKKHEKEKQFQNEENYVICPLCGEKMQYISSLHIVNKHNMPYERFLSLFPDFQLQSNRLHNINAQNFRLGNLVVSKNRFISSYEREIQEFLTTNNVKFETNRQMLIGKEIDILIEDKKIGIEFDGLKFHTEWFGKKDRSYHVSKTNQCLEKGYKLIHIFEDEYVNHKDIVYEKLKHILHLKDNNKQKIGGRKCTIKEIYKADAEQFLNQFHIQGFSSATIYLGAFYGKKLIAVMNFKNGNINNPFWELTRFASDYNYICQGVGGKLFNYFIKKYNPSIVISFADRRWSPSPDDNLYTKLGFTFDRITPPDYTYYDSNTDKFKRFHKMFYNKNKLVKLYGFPMSMTETEMAKEANLDRIWNCGLIKYVWHK